VQSTAWVSEASARVQFRQVPGVAGGAATSTISCSGRCRQCGEGPEDRNLRTGDGVEERDDQHRQRTGQHAGGQPRDASNCDEAERGRVPRGGPSKRGARTGDPADRCWGAKRWSMSTVIMPLPTRDAATASARRVDR
jgi:hypothetical protein